MKYEAPQKIPAIAAETPTITTTVTLAFQETVHQGWWWLAGVTGITLTVAGVVLTIFAMVGARIGWKSFNKFQGDLADTKDDLAKTKSELADTKGELADTKGELADTKKEVEKWQTSAIPTPLPTKEPPPKSDAAKNE